mmetsp:Transcript_31878/g.40886  ORF Transcript_31878/g.40886 Transcript_31878/m.40886 type:complete len:331 (+) Transcript_31878:154-1146(+)
MGAGGSSSFLGIEGGNHFLCRACRRTFVLEQGSPAGPPACPHCNGHEVEVLLMAMPGQLAGRQGQGQTHMVMMASNQPHGIFQGGSSGPQVTHTATGMPFPGGIDRSGVDSRIPSGVGAMLAGENHPSATQLVFQQGLGSRLATATTLFRLLEEHLRQELQMLQALEASENASPQAKPAGIKFMTSLEEEAKVFEEVSGTAASTDCTVCLEPFKAQDQVLLMPCNHAYHPSCLIPWLYQQNTCPDCRHEVRDQASETREELTSLTIHELRSQLTEAGLDHSACVEKSDLVELLQGHVDRARIQNREQSERDRLGISSNEPNANPPDIETT